MTMKRRRNYNQSIRATDKRAAENKEIIHLWLRLGGTTKMNSNWVQIIADGYYISHTDSN
jgi:hypothetical protein